MVHIAPGYELVRFHQDSVLAVEETGGVPALIHFGGRYPTIRRLSDGLTSGNGLPHISVVVGQSFARAGVHAHNALTELYHGNSMGLDFVAEVPLSGGSGLTESDMEAIRAVYPRALAAVARVPAKHEAANALLARVASLPRPMTRECYESACAQFGLSPRLDRELSTCGSFSPLAENFARREIDQIRAYEFEREVAAAEKAAEAAANEEREIGIAAARLGPVARTYTAFVVAGGPSEYFQNGELHTVVRRSGQRIITEDDPSCRGSHLLGLEGSRGETVTVEVRTRG